MSSSLQEGKFRQLYIPYIIYLLLVPIGCPFGCIYPLLLCMVFLTLFETLFSIYNTLIRSTYYLSLLGVANPVPYIPLIVYGFSNAFLEAVNGSIYRGL